ncbi:hypothetical protein NKOR_03860 [Candidatus Nitrosopumilus koreensis AR1]|uniref:Uncharacterized protein n=1 Tax=Candidatus Nitrosopumilus koreensis AR1 TaxID=1229908 RepID=K0B686_9ARCH|nr:MULTISPECIES: hypothetical protein [Nitrosopumilus]AFS80662.1 hypothetical protein NKOR_03860 [Candidatus Nitrosopumilus koreensis AR1]
MKPITIFRFFSPIRYIEIIAVLSAFQILDIAWQSDVIIFNFFFPVIIGSAAFDAVFHKDGFKAGFKSAGIKYYTGMGIQFVGSAVSALASFNTDPEKIPVIIMYTVLLLGIGGALEGFHFFSEKKLKNIVLTPVQKILALIGLTLLIFFFGLYTVLELVPRTPWFN